ncbi:MAG: hypothetical protein K9H16_11580 [Bacteroidales bacterium]|nr:hypothetical protein [Bacteroidales bacterium]
MSDTNDAFEKDLEQLIKLFKKIKDKTGKEHFAYLDPAFAQNLDFIISNYEMVKNNLPKEMLSQMGLPFQQMMHEFIHQLKTELGEEFSEDSIAEEITETAPGVLKKDLFDDIREIDAQLKKGGLSDEEINQLLDKRNSLLSS